MKMTMSLLLISLGFGFSAQATLQTVPSVDLSRYAGTWYQIARNPLFFEGNCFCSQQKLSAQADGNIGVYNSCNDGAVNGPLKVITGVAMSEDATNAKLTVDFNLPQKGEYWVIGLGDNYEYAVVSDPSMKSLYILSKTPTLAQNLLDKALATAAAQLDTSKLIMTVQQGCTYP